MIRMGAFVLILLGWITTSNAQQTGPQYLKLLSIASKQVKARKTPTALPAGVDPGSSVEFLGLDKRAYRENESWIVTFTPRSNQMTWMVGAAALRTPAKPTPYRFLYTVKKVLANQERIFIEVRQLIEDNGPTAEPGVDHLVFELSRDLVGIKKEVFFRDGRPPQTIELTQTQNLNLGFSAYPLELPALGSVRGKKVESIPEELNKLTALDLANALEFQTRDIYARNVRMIWRNGDPWPLYTETASGIAVLSERSSK